MRYLEVLTGMHAAFVDRARAQVAAVAETHLETGNARQLVFGECYLILEKKPEKSFEIFVDLVAHGVSRFIASREHPEKVKEHFASLQLHLCNYISAQKKTENYNKRREGGCTFIGTVEEKMSDGEGFLLYIPFDSTCTQSPQGD